jgi:hypothetical protein
MFGLILTTQDPKVTGKVATSPHHYGIQGGRFDEDPLASLAEDSEDLVKTKGKIRMVEGVYAHYHIEALIREVQVLCRHFLKLDPIRHLIEKGIPAGNVQSQGGQVDAHDFPGSPQRPYDRAFPQAAA